MKSLNYILAAAIGAFSAGVVLKHWTPEPATSDVVSPISRPVVTRTVESPRDDSAEELARVTKMNADLEAELKDAKALLVAREEALLRTQDQLEELRRPMTEDIMSSSLRAEMKSGEAIVTGGYRLPDGKRLYAFATPVVEPSADGGERVKIGFQMFRMTDEASAAMGLDTLSTNAANTLQHGEVWVADEYAEIVEKLKTTPGMEGTSYAPDITVDFGATGAVEAGDYRLKVTPERSGQAGGLNVELRLEQPAVTTPPQASASPAGS